LNDEKPYLIGVAGPSGAGKTELSLRLARLLDAPIISLDSYYRDMAELPFEQRARSNFDVPDALDCELLGQHLSMLASGREIAKPVYDFTRHTRAPEVESIQPGAFAIVEGLFALYWEDVRSLYGTRVYVDTDDQTCFERRLDRDTHERGRTPESVHAQYENTVRPMAERYILPTRRYADLIVSGTQRLERSAAAVLAHIEGRLPRPRVQLSEALAALAVG